MLSKTIEVIIEDDLGNFQQFYVGRNSELVEINVNAEGVEVTIDGEEYLDDE